jgi:hypothetical protein
MQFRISAHRRIILFIPAFAALAACSAGDSTGPGVDPSQPLAAKGSGSGGDPVTPPTPVAGTITGTWTGTLITPSGGQPTRMLLRQQGTDVTGEAYFLVGSTEQRLKINRGLVLKGTSITLLLLDGNGKESYVRYAGTLSADGRTMIGSVIDLRGPTYALDLTLQ